jgi:DNA-binding SARP family transcriptional activator
MGERVAQSRERGAGGLAAPVGAASTSQGLVRQRLVDSLEPSPDVRMCLLSGPQGSGKTTALAQWASATSSSVAVLAPRPDQGEADCRGAVADALARGATVLALDDADRHPTCVLVLRRVLSEVPRLRLVLTGRTPPAVDLARSELRTAVVPADVLRFREHEVSALFRDEYDAPLTRLDSARLTLHTDGWAAGLHLFHTSIANSTPAERGRAVAALGGRVAFARHYFHHQVLAGLSADVLAVLRHSSPLEALTSGRCRQLLGRPVERELHSLEACTLVTSPDAGLTRVVHPLLRAHLVTELRDELGDACVDQLLRRAARLHAEDGEIAAAARALGRAGAWEELEDLVRAHGARLWATRDLAWVQDLPADLVEGSPPLRLSRAVLRLHEGQLRPSTEDALAVAESTAGVEPLLHEMAEAVAQSARVWLEGSAHLSTLGPRPAARAALARPFDVLRTASTRERQDPDAVLASVIAHLLRGDVAGAREVAQRGPTQGTLLDLATRVLFAALEGPHRGQLECLARQARMEQRPWLAHAIDLLDLAYAYGRGCPDPDPLLRRTRESDEADDPWGAALACAIRATMLLLARHPDVSAFEELCDRLRELDAPALEAWSRVGLALSSVAADLPDADRDAEVAASYAAACRLPAVQALAQVAAAGAGGQRRADRLVLARAEAATVGFDVEPWVRLLEASTEIESVRETVPSLAIRCFGRFDISLRGVEPALHRVRPRAREVLRFLAVQQGRPVHREILLAALWPELDTRAATHNLHVAVSTLRTCLEPGIARGASSLVVRRGEHYQLLYPSDAQCDLTSFDRAVSEAAARRSAGDLLGTGASLERALEQYRGDVLAEDGPAEWVVTVRDHYRMRAGEVAGDLAKLRLELGEHHAAVTAARRSIELSPWRDASWRTLQVACRAAGDLAAAERARSDYLTMLAGLGLASG